MGSISLGKIDGYQGMISGFQREKLQGDGVEIDVLIGGSGPPLLLLHGYPQTRLCWKNVAIELLSTYTIIVPDLRGYGRSGKPDAGENHINYSKRTMARDMVEIMKQLGYAEFFVAGHDRGGRVAYRLALDHPQVVKKLAVLDIVPTVDVFNGINAEKGMKMFHWFFLVQDRGIAEHFINLDPEFFIRQTIVTQTRKDFEFDEESMQDYIGCMRDPATVHGICEDYRAAWYLDQELDKNDLGKVKISCPLLVLWGKEGSLAGANPLTTWRRWADDVRGLELPVGHFIPEEAPQETIDAFRVFFGNK